MRKLSLILLIFVIVGILSMSACSSQNGELESLRAENERLKAELALKDAEIENLKFGAEKLYKEAERYFNEGNLQKSKDTLNLLIEKHPASKETEQGKAFLAKVEEALKKEQEARELAAKQEQEKKEAEEKQRIANATKNMRTEYDEVKEITWYYDKTSPQYDNANNFLLYIGKDKNNNCWLRLRIRYTAKDWLFIRNYIFKVDDNTYTISPGTFDVERDNKSGYIWEWYDKSPTESEINMVKEIINSKKTVLRYEGDQYHYDRDITQQEKQALQNVLDAYTALGGSLNEY